MTKKKDLKKIILNDFKQAIKDTAIELNYQLAKSYNLSIEAFYDDYDPKYYERTGSLFDGSNLTKSGLISGYNKHNIENPFKNKNGYCAEIKVNGNYIHNNPYRADTDWVFERSFIKGIHGQDDRERRKWGNNEWWDRYLRSFPRYKNYPNGIRVNQYREYRNMYMHKGSVGGSYYGLNKAGKVVTSKLEKKWISGKDTKLFNLIQMNNYRHTMTGKKPIDLLYSSYKELRKRKNIETIFNLKLLEHLSSR